MTAFLDWLYIRPTFAPILKKKTKIERVKSRFSTEFEKSNPTIKYFVFEGVKMPNFYEQYFNINAEFDGFEIFTDFIYWIKKSSFAVLIHRVIDMLVANSILFYFGRDC